MCIRCGITKKGENDFFVCEDCQRFSTIVDLIFNDVEDKINNLETIDLDTQPIFRLLADSSFITAQNPHIAIFYKICELIVEKAVEGSDVISEEELNRQIKTTKSWTDVFKIFEKINLIRVETDRIRRKLILQNKAKKFAKQYRTGSPLSEQVRKRLAHIYSGYVLLHLIKEVSKINNEEDLNNLPYKKRPRTLWIILMFLWSTAYKGSENFTEEEMISFISKRRIPSSTLGKIIRSLQTIDGRSVQSLIKDVRINMNQRVFGFDDYVIIELERIRTVERERVR
jgi:NADH:ubiquinone oxidoreductase subunit 3 (subunit A)